MNKLAASRELTPEVIIIIQADDLGYDDLSTSGNAIVVTPNIERLARQSVQFTDFTVNPVCAPSRASLLTGRHFLRTGVSHVHGGKDFLHPNEKTIADYLQDAGWRTGFWGKWHLGTGPGYDPWDRGFQEAGYCELYKHKEASFHYADGRVEQFDWGDEGIVDQAIDFLRRRGGDSKSLLYLASMTPHTPLAASEAWAERYRKQGLSEGLSQLYGMVSSMDESLGRLFEFLEKQGLYEDTLVVFTSDNGPAINQGVLTEEERRLRKASSQRGWKGDLWQGGVRVPLFVRWPRGLQNGVVGSPVDQTDLLPTILSWCGIRTIDAELPFDGRDRSEAIFSLLKEPASAYPIYNYSHPGWITGAKLSYSPLGIPGEYNPVPPGSKASMDERSQSLSVRLGRFKLVRNPEQPDAGGRREMYSSLIDLYEDPSESVDCSERFPEERRNLESLLDRWFQEMKQAPHSFHAPVTVVSESETYLPSKHACEVYGGLQNSVFNLRNWRKAGDGASFAIFVRKAGIYRVELDWEQALPNGIAARLRRADGTLEPLPSEVRLGEGETRLVLTLVSEGELIEHASSEGVLEGVRLLKHEE